MSEKTETTPRTSDAGTEPAEAVETVDKAVQHSIAHTDDGFTDYSYLFTLATSKRMCLMISYYMCLVQGCPNCVPRDTVSLCQTFGVPSTCIIFSHAKRSFYLTHSSEPVNSET